MIASGIAFTVSLAIIAISVYFSSAMEPDTPLSNVAALMVNKLNSKYPYNPTKIPDKTSPLPLVAIPGVPQVTV